MDMLAVSLWIFILSFLLVQAEGVYNQRLQNLALTLDKVGAFHFSEESHLLASLLSIDAIGCGSLYDSWVENDG